MRGQVACEAADVEEEQRKYKVAFLAAGLLVVGGIVFAAHWPALSARAFLFDDDQYLIENRLVQNPSWNSAKRFLGEVLRPSTVRGYYQPLAMISLMLDYATGGRVANLTPFHRTSLLLHVANSLLLIIFLYLLFGQIWPAAMVGLLYGLHPTTIESVAWISERKTVLAAFFALWCLIFYVRYVHTGSWLSYAVCSAAYLLSLLSKPTIIAMPALLLLLDIWPLRRFHKPAVLEKLPLIAIGAASAIVTFVSQSLTSLTKLPGESGLIRIFLIFCHNIIFYLYNLVWPSNLSWYYPFPEPFNLSHPWVLLTVIGTCVLLPTLVISLRWTKCLLVGWLFFFAAIFPTLGVIGFHPVIAADRHMYFPMIGLLLPAAYLLGRSWTGKRLRLSRRVRRIVLTAAIVILSTSEFVLTRCYLVYWRDSETVYKYMLELSPNVAILHNNLANTLGDSGKVEEAIKHFKRSLELKPNSPEVHNNLGNALCDIGEAGAAIKHYRKALSLKRDFAVAHYNLARVLAEQGDSNIAITEYRQAVRFKQDYVEAWTNLGFLLAQANKFEQAVECYEKAIEFRPNFIVAHGQLALALARLGRNDEAIEHCRIVLQVMPDDVEMHFNVGILLERQGQIDEAIKQYRRALQVDPEYTKARERLEAALARQKDR
ncbi:MAG: tetratricopeptide repeat protein [Planctomycetota bacterium]